MALSGDYLIHRTREFDTLKKILTSKEFLYQYCKEEFQFGAVGVDKTLQQFRVAIPMISFSDINLDYLSEQINNGYGHFGICMDKGWAKEKGFTPVLYIDNSSDLGHRFYNLYDKQFKETRKCMRYKTGHEILQGILDLIGYMKNYKKVIPTINQKVPMGYNYYDEREWRLVCKEGLIKTLKAEVYEEHADELNDAAKEFSEKFEYSDIKFIFVENDEQKKDLIDFCKANSIILDFDKTIFTLDEKKIDYSSKIIK